MIDKKEIFDQIEDQKQLVSMHLPISLLVKIDDFIENDPYGKRHNSRTSAFKELLAVGLWFSKRRQEFEKIFKSPELMNELSSQLKEGGLVDFVEHMNFEEFQIVWSIFKNEAKDRKLI